MGSKKGKRLEAAVAAIQQRWGTKALRKAPPLPKKSGYPHIPTGFPALDDILGIGGVPRGRMTEILATPTAGMTTLAYKILAAAQQLGDMAVHIDVGYTFDPDYAYRCQVNLVDLCLVRPHTGREALELTYDLVASKGVGVLVFDSIPDLMTTPSFAISQTLSKLGPLLASSPCALVFLTPLYFGMTDSSSNYPGGLDFSQQVAVRLLLEKEEWLKSRRDIRGYRVLATVLKNKFAPAGRQASLTIDFQDTVQGNGT